MALKLVSPWTFGALVNQVTDIAGDNDHLNTSFIQPFLVYTTASATSFALNTETTYDGDAKETAMPINRQVNPSISCCCFRNSGVRQAVV